MEFLDSYFEDEVREGFYVPSLMKRAWAAQMELLEVVQNICDKHQIPLYAEWGTLLGAVRHKEEFRGTMTLICACCVKIMKSFRR